MENTHKKEIFERIIKTHNLSKETITLIKNKVDDIFAEHLEKIEKYNGKNDGGKTHLTEEGLYSLITEQILLIEVERLAVIQDIAEARSQGDLSENAEFDVARERQGQIEDRIKEIDANITKSILITNINQNVISIGSTVTVEDQTNGKQETYTIVGSLEANPFERKVSNVSPLAIALLGAKKGETVTVDTEEKYDVKVVDFKKG